MEFDGTEYNSEHFEKLKINKRCLNCRREWFDDLSYQFYKNGILVCPYCNQTRTIGDPCVIDLPVDMLSAGKQEKE